jgi:hypothetical protein
MEGDRGGLDKEREELLDFFQISIFLAAALHLLQKPTSFW